MKYVLRELLNGPKNLDNAKELGNRECQSMEEVVNLMKEMENRGLILAVRKEKKDYDKISWVELYFQNKQ
jgi:hypothetical protein